MTYDPRTKKINYAPVEEISKLRGKSLGSLSAVTAPTALPASSACDMEVHFAKPSGPVTFAVEVNGGTFYLDYTSDSQPAKVGFNATAEHAPGAETRYHYLTFAWACGGLIEAVTGRPYEQFLNARLLEPALAGQSLSDELLMGGLPDSVETGKLAVLSMGGRNRDASRPGETSRRGETNATNGRTTRLAKYQGREQMLNPSIFNMRKVRAAKLPSANGHASAAALAAVLDVLGATYRAASAEGRVGNESRLFSAACVDEMRVDQRPAGVGGTTVGEDGVARLDNAGAAFGLGVQVHEFVLSDGSKCRSIGHSGLGGSEAITLPEAGISFAFTTNTLSMDSTAKVEIVRAICEELGIRAPLSLLPAV